MTRWTEADARQIEEKARGFNAQNVIGIDSGVKTGFAVYDRINGKMVVVKTLDFWSVYEAVQAYDKRNTRIVIEVSKNLKVWSEGKSKGSMGKISTASRVSANVGGVRREAELMSKGLQRLGYQVKEVHPLGKVDAKKFKQLTGYEGRSSEHARDAGMLAFKM